MADIALKPTSRFVETSGTSNSRTWDLYSLSVAPGLVTDSWTAYFNYIRTVSDYWNASQVVGATLTGVVNAILQVEPQLDVEIEEALRGLRAFTAQLRSGIAPDAPP